MSALPQSSVIAGFAGNISAVLPPPAANVIIDVLSRLERNLNTGFGALQYLTVFAQDQLKTLSIDRMLIRNMVSQYAFAVPAPIVTIAAAGNTIYATSSWVKISNTTGGAIVLTSTPTIPSAADGQFLEILNIGTKNVTIQDFGTLANSNVQCSGGAANRVLAPGQTMLLRYNANLGRWLELGR